MIIDLAKMVSQMAIEMYHKVACRFLFVMFQHREVLLQRIIIQLAESRLHHGNGLIQVTEQCSTRYILTGKLQVALAHIAGTAQRSAKKMIEIAYEVQGQVSGGVADLTSGPPDVSFILIGSDLFFELIEVADKELQKLCAIVDHILLFSERKIASLKAIICSECVLETGIHTYVKCAAVLHPDLADAHAHGRLGRDTDSVWQ